MEAIKEELDLYRAQINELNGYKQAADKEINGLLSRVDNLEGLLQKANVANHDLFQAFSHVREENNIIKSNQTPPSVQVVDASDGMFDWARNTLGSIRTHETMKRQIRSLQRDRDRCLKENVRLSRQVRYLLRKLETEKGRIVPDPPKEIYGSVITGSDVINMNLLTFGSIEELQQNNQRLLALVHDLSEKQEVEQQHIEDENTKRLYEEINQLKGDLEKVTDDRQKILEKFETIMKERDLLSILYTKNRDIEHMTPEIFQNMVAVACTSTSIQMNPPDVTDKESHIKDLQESLSALRQELSEEKENNRTQIRRLNEELSLKTELLEKAHLIAKGLKTECDSERERTKTLDSNINSLMAEFEELRTKHQKLTLEVQQQDTQSIVDAKDALIQELRLAIESKAAYISRLEDQQQECLGIIRSKESQLSELTMTISRMADSKDQQAQKLGECLAKLGHQEMLVSQLRQTIVGLEEEVRRKPEPVTAPPVMSPPVIETPVTTTPALQQSITIPLDVRPLAENSTMVCTPLSPPKQQTDCEEKVQSTPEVHDQFETLIRLRDIERARRLKTLRKLMRATSSRPRIRSNKRPASDEPPPVVQPEPESVPMEEEIMPSPKVDPHAGQQNQPQESQQNEAPRPFKLKRRNLN